MYSEVGKERKIVMELTREGLRAAGIQDAQIDEILAARGQEIASALQREQDLKNQLDSLNVKVKTVDDIENTIGTQGAKNISVANPSKEMLDIKFSLDKNSKLKNFIEQTENSLSLNLSLLDLSLLG